MKKLQQFVQISYLWGKLLGKISFVTALLLSVNLLQAQTFKAVPLDGGGWTSGFAQANNGRIYAYGDVFGAWRTDNGGTNWSYLNWDIPGGDIVGYGMAVQKDNADVVYYSTNTSLWKSTNGGTTWTKILTCGDNLPRFRGASPIMIRSNNSNEIWFAGTRSGQTGWLWRSQDGGANWTKMGGTAFDSNRSRTFHNVSQYPNQIWVGADDGLHVSTNGGSSFTRVGDLNTVSQIQRFTSGPNAGIGLVARGNGTGGVSRITATDFNNASTYTVTESGTVNLYFGYPSGLQIFSDGTASAWNTSGDRHGFSNDGGLTFTHRLTTLNTNPVPIWTTAAIMAAKNHPDYGTDMVIEDVTNPNKWIITGGGAAMYTLDKGFSWQYFPNASGIAAVKAYLAGVSRHDANRIYIPASDIGSAIVTDGGASGQATRSSCKFFTNLHGCFRIMEGPNANNLVLAGVNQANSKNILMKSSDGGVTWAEVSTGNLPASSDGISKSVMSLNNSDDFLVVLSEIGSPAQRVYRTTNGGSSFSGVNGLPDNMSTGGRYGPQNSFIERDATNNNVRYFIARGQNLYKSTDGGSNWSASTAPFGTSTWAWAFHADPIRSNNLWAAGDYAGIKYSRDGGATWTSTAQYFDARYVSSCDGKIAVWGKKDGGDNPILLWYSSDDGATWSAQTSTSKNFHAVQGITVDRNGKIWVSWNSCTVVTPGYVAPVAVTGVSVNPTSATIGVGGSTNLTATVAPTNATNQSVTWSSSNTAIATVSSSGLVTGVAAGTATITVKTNDGNKTATCAVTVTAPIIPTGVTVSPTSATVNTGATQQLTATVAPSNASNKNVTWSSSNNSVATVSATGVVTGVATGTATITVTTVSGAKTATCAITVPNVAVTGVSLNVTSASITTGGTTSLTATVSPSNATNKNVSWSSSNTSIATVNSSGVVTGIAVGNATITVTTQDGAKTATCAVTVGQGKLVGTVIGTTGSYNGSGNTRDKAFDNNTSTFFDAPGGDGNWVGLDINTTYRITTIKYFPRGGLEYRMNGGKFQGSSSSTFSSGVVDLATIGTASAGWNTITVTNTNTFRYVRYLAPAASYGNVAEIEFYGTASGSTTVAVTGVTLSPTTVSIAAGTTSTLTATVAPSNATNKTVSWSSSNTSIATVNSSGVVAGIAAGTATITVTTQDGAKTATCAVTVTGTPSTGKLNGTVIGTTGSYNNLGNTRDKAFDGNTATFFDAPSGDGNWVGLDLGATYQITSIKYFPRSGLEYRMNGGIFQASNTADFSSGVVALNTITANPPLAWSTATVSNATGYRYVRYLAPSGSYGNVAEIEFYGSLKSVEDSEVVETVDEITNISNSSNIQTIIYPNPVSNILHIAGVENATINIYSIEGKLITNLKATTENVNINVANYNKGVYILSVSSANKNIVSRIIVR